MGERQARIHAHRDELAVLFKTWGMLPQQADRFAHEIAVKAERAINPQPVGGIAPKVRIEDRYHSHSDIRIFIRRDVDRKPEDILAEFIERSKGLPPITCWDITQRQAANSLGGSDWVAKVIAKPTTTDSPKVREKKARAKSADANFLSMLENLDPAKAKAFAELVQERMKASKGGK